MKTRHSKYGGLWIGIGILILLAPLGLILPKLFQTGGAWGEWGADEIKDIAGYLPEGLKRISELWSAPMPDYAFTGWDKGVKSYIAYIISGLIGVALVVAVSYVLGKVLKGGAMNEIDRLSHLLEHWMEHNEEHAETYREWAEKAEALGNKELSEVLQRLYRETKNLNSLLEEAKGKIG